jgi:hypothetical protein
MAARLVPVMKRQGGSVYVSSMESLESLQPVNTLLEALCLCWLQMLAAMTGQNRFSVTGVSAQKKRNLVSEAPFQLRTVIRA